MSKQKLERLGCNPPRTCFSCQYPDCIAPCTTVTKAESDWLKAYLSYGNNKNTKEIITQEIRSVKYRRGKKEYVNDERKIN